MMVWELFYTCSNTSFFVKNQVTKTAPQLPFHIRQSQTHIDLTARIQQYLLPSIRSQRYNQWVQSDSPAKSRPHFPHFCSRNTSYIDPATAYMPEKAGFSPLKVAGHVLGRPGEAIRVVWSHCMRGGAL